MYKMMASALPMERIANVPHSKSWAVGGLDQRTETSFMFKDFPVQGLNFNKGNFYAAHKKDSSTRIL
jgi:hypothetical protein